MKNPLLVTILTISLIGVVTLTAGLLCHMERAGTTVLADSLPEDSSGVESVVMKTITAWCTEFVIWCIFQAEEAFGTQYVGEYFPGYDSAYACSLWNESNGSLRLKGEYVPRRGDLIYFDYDFDGYADHTGLVTDIAYDEKEEMLYVLTVEGNLPEDFPNGVICERRLELDADIIFGYGTFDSLTVGEAERS